MPTITAPMCTNGTNINL